MGGLLWFALYPTMLGLRERNAPAETVLESQTRTSHPRAEHNAHNRLIGGYASSARKRDLRLG